MPRWLSLSVKFPLVKSFLLVVTTWKEEGDETQAASRVIPVGSECLYS